MILRVCTPFPGVVDVQEQSANTSGLQWKMVHLSEIFLLTVPFIGNVHGFSSQPWLITSGLLTFRVCPNHRVRHLWPQEFEARELDGIRQAVAVSQAEQWQCQWQMWQTAPGQENPGLKMSQAKVGDLRTRHDPTDDFYFDVSSAGQKTSVPGGPTG